MIMVIFFAVISSCGTQKKIKYLQKEMKSAEIALPEKNEVMELSFEDNTSDSDTLRITDLQGNPIILMKAVQDEESGEMVATQKLEAAVVTARFRNIAERNGEVGLEFDIIVPKSIQDEKWQVRFTPHFIILGDTLQMEDFVITGKQYRINQLNGYEKYNKYLSSIITDPNDLVYMNLLNIFVERNPRFQDISYTQIYNYYTKKALTKINERKKKNRWKKYDKFIKDPIVVTGIKRDSVTNGDDVIIYRYLQTIATKPKLRKVEMAVEGKIYMEGRQLYAMPISKPLTFYISSLSSFTEEKTMYIQKIIERKAEANSAAYITFPTGKEIISDTLGNNKEEIQRITENIREILLNKEFDLDSIVITASCSPEGTYLSNVMLSQKRAESINNYFSNWIREYKKEDIKEKVLTINAGLTDEEKTEISNTNKSEELTMITRSKGEEWDRLHKLIESDTLLKERDYLLKCFSIKDLDKRELSLMKSSDYPYIRRALYPMLRVVKFDFHLHRKGMVKDTVHTTEIDTVYQSGIKALQDRDYEKAILLLRPYSDFNTALAYSSLDYNSSALSILETLPQNAKRDYMLAVIYSRQGKEKKAVKHYLYSVEQDPSMIHRGNLDPEISVLIRKYNINNY